MSKLRSFQMGLGIIDIAINEQQREHDSCFLISGIEGVGKSTFLLWVIEYYCQRKHQTPTLEGMASTLSGFIHKLKMPQESMICLDEGSELASDRQLEGLSKAIRTAFTVMRAKKFLSFICFTNPMKVNTYFKEDRVKGLFFIPSRGTAYWYKQSTIVNVIMPQIKKMDNKSLVHFSQFKPDLKFSFPKYNGVLWEEYQKLKMDNIDSVLEELQEEYGTGEVLYSLVKASKFLRVTPITLRRFLAEGSIPYKRNATNTKFLIKETDLVEYLKKHQDPVLVPVPKKETVSGAL